MTGNVHERKLSEVDAKNEALRLNRREKFRKGKSLTDIVQYEAAKCAQCNAWHVFKKTRVREIT